MIKKLHSSPKLTSSRWFRLSFVVALALTFSLTLLFIPITAGTLLQIPLPGSSQSETMALSLPLGVETVHAAGGLTLTKVAIAPTVDQGSLLTYTLIVTNGTGADISQEIVVTDTIPANTTCFDIIDSVDGTWLGSSSLCGSNTLAFWTKSGFFVFLNNSVVTLTYVVSVTEPLIDQSLITNLNTSYAISTSTIFDTGVDTVNTIVNAPLWQIGKVADPAPVVEAGTALTYTLTVTNIGHLASSGAYTVTDAIPDNTTYVTDSASPTATFDGTELTWVFSSPVSISQAFTVSFVVTVTEPLTDALEIVNQTYSITGGNVFSQAFGEPVTVTVDSPVTMTITKTDDPDPVQAGNLITYTLTVTNETSSKGPAANVVVTDTLPANTSLEDAGFFTPTVGTTSTLGSVITWTITNPDPIPIGQAVNLFMTVRVTSPLTNNTVITNDTYTANASNGLVTILGQPVVTTTVESTPTLEIFKEGLPQPVEAGGQLTYTIRYTNTGNANATNMVISDTFPVSTSFQSEASSPVVSGTAISGGRRWNVGTVLGNGGGGLITLTLNISSPQATGTVLTNVVAISSSQVITPVLFTATNTISSTPELNISKSADPSPVAVGAVLTYTITFSNTGNADATGVVISDVLDNNVTFNGATGGGIHSNGVVTWTGLSVPADGLDQTLVMSVTVGPTLPDNSILTNNVQIVTGTVVATDSITTLVRAPALTITKIVSPTGILRAGDNIEYTIIYTNTGPITITFPGILITDTFPVSVTNIVSGSTEATFQTFSPPNTYIWSDLDVPANGGSGTITITGQVITSPWASTGGQIINDVIVAGNGYSATTTVSNQGRPGLPVTITVIAVPPTQQVNNNILVGAQAVDAFGNDIFDGTPITLTTSLAGSTLNGGPSPLVLTTSGGGVTATLFSTVAGTTTVAAQVAGASSTITDTTVATFTPSAVVGFILQATTPQTAGVAFPITIRAVDAFSNTVNTVNQSITISDTTGTIVPTSVTLVNGITTTNFIVTQATSPALDTITAISGTITGTVGVEIRPNTPATLTVTINPTTIRVCDTANITATITDNVGNGIPGQSVDLSVFPGPVPNGAATLSSPSGVTNAAGVFTSTLQGTGAGNVRISGVSGPLTNSPQPVVNITAPVPLSLTLTVAPNPLATGGNTALVTATVTDCTGPSVGQVVTFTVSNPTLATLSPASDTTNASGVATTTLTSNSIPQDGTVVVTATIGSLVQTTTVTLQTAALTITKTANPAAGVEVRPGQIIDYTLIVMNTGTGVANNVVITDILPAGVTFASCTSNGACAGGSTTTVTTPTLGAGQSLAATIQVNVTAATSGTLISNNATAGSSQTGLITSNIVAHSVTTATVDLYLPIILKDFPPAIDQTIDLTITSFTVTGTNPNRVITIVVENGSANSTGEGFWVDFYLNPTTLPDNPALGSNRRWELMGSTQGIAWPIPALNAGESVTLTSNGAAGTLAPAPSPLSNWTGTLPSGSNNLYAFVDSFAEEGTSFVEIEESDENNNLASLVIVAATGVEIEPSSVPDLNNLPPRWKP